MQNIDRYNANILRELQANGRISNIDLAQRVGLSPSACLRRVQELERSGVIGGYRAVLNPEALGIFGYSFLDQNRDKVQGSLIDGEAPEFEAIAEGT